MQKDAIEWPKLTPRQHAFACKVAFDEYPDQVSAYLAVYGKKQTRKTARENASRLATKPEVVATIQQLRKLAAESLHLGENWATCQFYRLATTAESESVQLAAIARLAEAYAPERYIPTSKSQHVNVDVDLAQLVAQLPKAGAPKRTIEAEVVPRGTPEESTT